MVALSVVGGRRVGPAPGLPTVLTQTENDKYPAEEPWPYNAVLIYCDDNVVDVQVDVIAAPDVPYGQEGAVDVVARKVWEWFRGAGRYELKRGYEVRVQEVEEPSMATELGGEIEEGALAHMRFVVSLVVPTAFAVEVPTIESVDVTPTYAVGVVGQEEIRPENEIELEPGHKVSVSSDEPDPALEYMDQ